MGEGSGLASKRREWQRREEWAIAHSREADWIVHSTGKEIARRGQVWGQ